MLIYEAHLSINYLRDSTRKWGLRQKEKKSTESVYNERVEVIERIFSFYSQLDSSAPRGLLAKICILFHSKCICMLLVFSFLYL